MIYSVDVEKAFNKFQNLCVTSQTALGKLAMGGKIRNVLELPRNRTVSFTHSGEAVPSGAESGQGRPRVMATA